MQTSKRTAYFSYTETQITITSPYDADFVAQLKSELKSRRWHPVKKAWIVDIKERNKLTEIASRFYSLIEDDQNPDANLASSQLSGIPDEATPGTDIAAVLKPGTELEIWADGSCVKNPGPGGYGIIFKYQEHKWEKAGGFRCTTNNRMEITGVLVALESLPAKCKVIVFSDSQYVVNSMTKGWAKRWKSEGWIKKGGKKVPNADLWQKMLNLCAKHKVEFKWVKGHDGSPENERCDQMAQFAARQPNLPEDKGYKKNESEA